MANITFKRTSVSGKKPLPGDLEVGELAVNLADKVLYTKNTNNEVILLSGAITAPEGSSDVISVDGRTGVVTLSDLYATLAHTHTEDDITDLDKYTQAEVDGKDLALQVNIDGKANLVHTHTEDDITDLDKYTQAEVDALLAGIVGFSGSYNDLTDVPTEFSPSAHTHTEAQITDLDKYTKAEVDAAILAGGGGNFSGSYNDLTDVPTEFTPEVHTHTEAQITDLDKYTQAEVDAAIAGVVTFSGAYGDLTGTPTEFTPSAHTHTKSEITDFSDSDYATSAQGATADTAIQPGANNSVLTNDAGFITLAEVPTGGTVSYNDLTDKPTEFTPEAHTHTEAQITDLDKYTVAEVDSALALKQDQASAFDGAYGSLTGTPTEFTPSAHTHTEAQITDLDKYTQAEVDALLVGSGGLSAVVEDTAPQLGGNLDVNGNTISGSTVTFDLPNLITGDNLQITGEGATVLDVTWDSTNSQSVFDTTLSGLPAKFKTSATTFENNEFVTKGFTDSNYVVKDPTGDVSLGGNILWTNSTNLSGGIVGDDSGNISFTSIGTGNITISKDGVPVYNLPDADGTADQVITTDGAGNLSFAEPEVPVSTETTFGGFKHTFVGGVLNLITV